MRRCHAGVGPLLVACIASSPSLAGDRFGIALRAGTYGVGGDLGFRVNKYVGLRASVQRLAVSVEEEEIDEIVYDGDLDLGGEGLLVDIFPTKGKFRLCGGFFSNRNDIALEGIVTDDIEIGDAIYSPDEVGNLTGGVEFDDGAGYVGIGWGNVAKGKGRIGFIMDAGLLLQDVGTVTLESDTGLVDPGDIEEEIAEIEDDISDYDFWPVISAGIAIRF